MFDGGEQAAALGAAPAAQNLQAGARCRIHRQLAGSAGRSRAGETRHRAHLRGGDVGQHLGGGERLGVAEGAERIQAGGAEFFRHLAPRRAGVGRQLHGQAQRGHAARAIEAELQRLGGENFRRVEAAEHGGKAGFVHLLGFEQARGNIGPGKAQREAIRDHREQKIGPACFQQTLFRQRAGGHQPHHVARQRPLRPARLGRRRVLHLLDDGDAEATTDQPRQIHLRLPDRHTAHRNRLALMLATGGQRNIQRRRRRLRVGEEQLIEIAHAEKQQGVFMPRLDGEPLRHGGAGPGGAGESGRRQWFRHGRLLSGFRRNRPGQLRPRGHGNGKRKGRLLFVNKK